MGAKIAAGVGLAALLTLGGGYAYNGWTSSQEQAQKIKHLDVYSQVLQREQRALKNIVRDLVEKNKALEQIIDARILQQAGMADGKYDFSPAFIKNLPDKLKAMENSVYYTVSYATYEMTEEVEGKKEKKYLTSGIYGKGIVVQDEKKLRLLTANHVVSQYELKQKVELPGGEALIIIPGVVKKKEVSYLVMERAIFDKFSEEQDLRKEMEMLKDLVRQGKILPLEDVVRNRETDIAAFNIPAEASAFLHKFPFPLGDSKRLEVGNYVSILASPQLAGSYISDGRISALVAPGGIQEVFLNDPRQEQGMRRLEKIDPSHNRTGNPNFITIATPVIPGTSGSAVIAWLDGEPHLVAIVQISWGYQGVATKINLFKEEIAKAEATNPFTPAK